MDDARRPVRFRELLCALVEGGVHFIVVGGVAAVLEGAPVSTFDLDIVYALDEMTLEAVIASKEEAGREKDCAVLPLLRQVLAERGEGS